MMNYRKQYKKSIKNEVILYDNLFFLTNVIWCYIVYISMEVDMKIIISNNSPVPIYEQIKNTIIDQIMTNELEENEPLPSIRHLAEDIKISVMTIKKAYDELEKEGYIVSIQGKGTFVAPKNSELIKEQAWQKIEKHFKDVIEIANTHQIKKEKLIDLINIFYGSDQNE